MYKRLGAALIAVVLMLHSLLGFGTGTAWAAEPQAGMQSSAEAASGNSAAETRTEVQESKAKETEPAAGESAPLAEPAPQLQPAEEEGESGAVASEEQTETDISVEEAEQDETVHEEAQPSNILTSVSLTDDEGHAVGDGSTSDIRIEPDQALNLNYDWALPNDHTYKEGSTFEFDLPQAFRIYTEIRDVPLTTGGDEGESAGSFSVDTNGHATVVFGRFVEDHSNVSGTITVRSELKEEIVRESTEVRIPFAIGESEQVFVLYLKPKQGSLLDKKGEADNAAGRINWTLDLNTSLQKLDSVSLNDPIPDGLTLDPESVNVYKLGVSTSGERTQGEKLSAEQYTLSGDGSSGLKLSFNSASIDRAYRVTYATTVGTGTQTQFTNTAALTASGKEPVTASATVSVKRGELLNKSVGAYDRSTQTIDWKIRYNAGMLSIPRNQALLKDRFNSGQRLVEGSLNVTESATGRVLVEGTDYTRTAVPVSGGRTGFDLQFLSDVTGAYEIAYRTTAADAVYNNDRITNTVTTGTVSKSASQTLQRSLLTKVNTGVNYKSKTASWRTIVNEDNFRMENAVLTDTFPNGGLELVPGTLKVLKANGTAMNTSDYAVSITAGNRSGFVISFNQTLTDRVTVTYNTSFNQTWKTDRSQADFVNAAKLSWTENGTARSRDVTARFTPDGLTLQNGSKSGSYNPQSKELTWDVKVNYNNLLLSEAVLTDTLRPGQRYVENSLNVYNLVQTGAKNGTQKGTLVDPADYSVAYPSADNGGVLRIAFSKTINTPYWITFKTTVDGAIVGKTVSNEAVLTSADANPESWSAEVPIPGGGEYVTKTGIQKGSRIDWSVTINRGQSYVENAKLIDTPTGEQSVDETSFRLYKATAASDGTLTRGEALVKGRDYGVVVMSSDTGERFELTFAQPIRGAFILDYATAVYAPDRSAVGNSVRFEGTGVTTGQTEADRSVTFRASSGSGTGSGVRGALEVIKIDAQDVSKRLAGATFTLQDTNKRRPAVTRTTDADGRILFGQLLYGSYELTETRAPEGYALDKMQPSLTVVVGSDASGTNGPKSVTVRNEPLPSVPEPSGPPEVPGGGGPGEPGGPTDPPVTPGGPDIPPTEPPTPTAPPTDGGTPSSPDAPGTTEPETPVPDDGVPSGTPSVPPSDNGTPAVSTPPDDSGTPTEPEVSVPDEGGPQGSPETPEVPSSSEPDVPLPDDGTPVGTPEIPSVPPAVPGEPETSVPDDGVPQGTPPVVPGTVVLGTVVPESQPTLPQTGESSRAPYLLAGAALLLAGLWLRRRAARSGE
ncbi:collagen binding domain-containing protein [Saccharibacillus sp. O23]|uniref:collagen binding domain-containing protein n=1 Tax=Saccharibacillus sp. O23 TaxID=2009338 RepID=UPI0015C6519B|nr:collagen binding domain-containing protein [Saccharibacillus sp. O23]